MYQRRSIKVQKFLCQIDLRPLVPQELLDIKFIIFCSENSCTQRTVLCLHLWGTEVDETVRSLTVLNIFQFVWTLDIIAVLVFIVVIRNVHQWKHAVEVPGKLSDAAPFVDVPASDGGVRRAGENEISGANESVDALLVSTEDGQTDAGCHVPLAYRGVHASADHEDLLNNDTRDVVLVASQDADAVAPGSLRRPQSDGVVVRPGGQDRAVFAHRHAVDRSRVILQHVKIISSPTANFVFDQTNFLWLWRPLSRYSEGEDHKFSGRSKHPLQYHRVLTRLLPSSSLFSARGFQYYSPIDVIMTTALATTFSEHFSATIPYRQRSRHTFDTVIAVDISLYFDDRNTLLILILLTLI